MKKQTLAVLLAATLSTSMLWGCGKGNDAAAPASTAEPASTAALASATAPDSTVAPASTAAPTATAESPEGSEAETAEIPADAKAGAAEASVSSDASAPDDADLPDLTGHTLMIYCGAGMTKPFQEIADAFKQATGCELNVTYANAGQIQSQINTSEEGDLFIAGSGDELKPVESYVASKKDLVKHIPVLAVQSGNPKKLTGLESLTGEDVKLIMGDVDSTPIGKIAKKALTDAGIFDQVHIEATTATAPQMSTAIAAGEADAAIVWKENCDTRGVEIVNTKDLEPYIKTIPAASLSCSEDGDALDAFNRYLDTDSARAIWMKYGYEIVE